MKTVAEHLAHHASMCGRHTVARMDDDPLTSKGEKIMSSMKEEYGSDKGEEVFYASANKGKITGVHDDAGVAGIIAPSPTGLAAVRGRRPGE